MQCHKVRWFLHNHLLNKLLSPKNFAHHDAFILFVQSWKSSVIRFFTNVSKLQKQGVKDVLNINKVKFEPCGDLFNQVLPQFSETLINDQDPHSQVKSDETAGAEIVNSFNSKQREIFNVVHRWPKDYIKHNGQHFEPIHMFYAGSEGRGKFHLVKIIYHVYQKYCFIIVKGMKNEDSFYQGLQEYQQLIYLKPPSILVLEWNLDQSYWWWNF